MEAVAEGQEHPSLAQSLTVRQRSTLLTYARTGTVARTARELGIAASTVKNHLTAAYQRLGVDSGAQAVFAVMGGEVAARRIPDPSTDVPSLRHRVNVLERQLMACESDLRASREREIARHATSLPPADALYIPLMTDGRISMKELRRWSSRFDADATSTSEMRITAREWADLLSYYVRASDSGMVDQPLG